MNPTSIYKSAAGQKEIMALYDLDGPEVCRLRLEAALIPHAGHVLVNMAARVLPFLEVTP